VLNLQQSLQRRACEQLNKTPVHTAYSKIITQGWSYSKSGIINRECLPVLTVALLKGKKTNLV
jgi:hypothetical protein